MSKYSKLRVLILLLEFGNWSTACKMPYNAMFGLEEGLRAQGIEPLTLTTSWLPRAQQICEGQKFDQVWMEVVHQNVVHPGWLEWVSELAPVRLAFLPESLEYTAEELAVMPRLVTRRHGIETRLRYMTHALSVDEKDAERMSQRGALQAQFWPISVPKRFVVNEAGPMPEAPAIFPGTSYGWRQDFLEHPALRGMLAQLAPPEQDTIFPLLFDGLQQAAATYAENGRPGWQLSLPAYMDQLRHIRQTTFGLWLRGLQAGSAVVNLPHMVKTYAGRVYEGIAAGRPVVSWGFPDRPRNRALWEEDSEILLFQRDSPEQLAEHIQRLRCDHVFATKLANTTLQKLRRFHTAEHRVGQILDWIDSGTEFTFA